MAKDYEGSLPEGFSRCPNLPQFKVHDECGAVVVDTAAHITWHERLKSDVMNASLPQVLR